MQSKESGFTIIEVVVSLFIVGIMLVIYAAASNTMVLNQTSKNRQLALRIASTSLENLRATSYTSISAGTSSISDPLLSSLPSSSGNVVVSSFNASTKKVVSTVTWKEPGNNNTRTVSLTTLITQGGLGQ